MNPRPDERSPTGTARRLSEGRYTLLSVQAHPPPCPPCAPWPITPLPRYCGRSASCHPRGSEVLGLFPVASPLSPRRTGLPDSRPQPAGHSVSNHLRILRLAKAPYLSAARTETASSRDIPHRELGASPFPCCLATPSPTKRSSQAHKGGAPPLEFVHFGLTAKYQLTTALARLRERGDREAVGEGFADCARRKQPLTSGFVVPSPQGLKNGEISGAPLQPCPLGAPQKYLISLLGFCPCIIRAIPGISLQREASSFIVSQILHPRKEG